MRILILAVIACSSMLFAPEVLAAEKPIALPLELVIAPKKRVCKMMTPSGLGYKVLRAGAGKKPEAQDTAVINYIGYLNTDGRVFDQNTSASLPVGAVIAGFAEGLQLMPVGSIYRLCIPAKLGYGDREAGPIPAGSDLVFQVEILEIQSAESE